MNYNEEYKQMLSEFAGMTFDQKWNCPFPMGVFGTLRKGWGNHHLMGFREGAKQEATHYARDYCYKAHFKAFLPDFHAISLGIHYHKGASAPFEVFVYDYDQWQQMIIPVDRLEGFDPDHGNNWYYYRTLAALRILPADFQHPLFAAGNRSAEYSRVRDLQLPTETWNQYPTIPCWIYSSLEENSQATAESIIWDGEYFGKEPLHDD